ncbi:MAG: alpha-galactosidase [Verrucomicrobiales bacterium]
MRVRSSRLFRILVPALAMGAATSFSMAQTQEIIEEQGIKVTVETTSGSARVESGGRVVVPELRCGNGGKFTKAEWVQLNEPLGAARALSLAFGNGRSVLLAVFPGRPFLCLRQQISNEAETDSDFADETVAELLLDAGAEPSALRAFGTGGLSALDKNPGSYMYQAVVHPATGKGFVGGWLSSDRGSGVFFTATKEGKTSLKAVTQYGRLRLKPRTSERGEWLALGWFDDARLGLEAYADGVAAYHGIRLPAQPTGYCTWYSQPNGGAGDEKTTAELAAFLGKELKPFGLGFLQIDDKWQIGKRRQGPAKDFTGAASNGPYPAGMKAAADSIRSAGLTPGLWFMPFAGDHEDPFFADKTDWFVKTKDGKVFETPWGGTSIDMSHPPAREHLKTLVNRFIKEWGYGYLKMDGLYTGLGVAQVYVHEHFKEDGFGQQVFADPYQTPVEIFRAAMATIREAAGSETYLLGCCIPQNLRSMGASFGKVDAMRIGADNSGTWKKGSEGGAMAGPINGTRRWFMHGRIWHNDPDPIYVRPSLTLDQARSIATWSAITGQLNTHSEWTPGLPPERLEILRRTMGAPAFTARPVDVFENDPARVWVTGAPGTNAPIAVSLFNWETKPLDLDLPMESLGLKSDAAFEGWEFWSNQPVLAVSGRLKVKLAAHSCQVIVLRPKAATPLILSSSRHVLQSMFGCQEESWDGAAKRLSGQVTVIGGDALELRILLPDEGHDWNDGAVVLAEEAAAAGVRASLAREGPIIRLRFESPETRSIPWALQW